MSREDREIRQSDAVDGSKPEHAPSATTDTNFANQRPESDEERLRREEQERRRHAEERRRNAAFEHVRPIEEWERQGLTKEWLAWYWAGHDAGKW